MKNRDLTAVDDPVQLRALVAYQARLIAQLRLQLATIQLLTDPARRFPAPQSILALEEVLQPLGHTDY